MKLSKVCFNPYAVGACLSIDARLHRFNSATLMILAMSLEADLEYKRIVAERDILAAKLASVEELVSNGGNDLGPVLDDYAQEWRRYRFETREVSPSTARNDERNVRTILKHLGGRRLGEIDRADVRSFYSALMSDGGGLSGQALSGCSAQDVAICLTMIFKQAVGDGLLAKSPCDGVKLPRIDTKEKTALSDSDVRKVVRLMTEGEPDAHKIAVLLMLSCGLRRGEVCALRWCDYDRDASLLHIRHTFSQARKPDGSIEGLKEPKTAAGSQAIPLGEQVQEWLEDWRVVQAVKLLSLGLSQDEERPIVTNSVGGFMRPTNLGKWWDKFRAQKGIDATLHQLRHTFATRLVANGVDMITAKNLMRHKTIDMIAKVYAHAVPRNLRDAVETISDQLSEVEEPKIVKVQRSA